MKQQKIKSDSIDPNAVALSQSRALTPLCDALAGEFTMDAFDHCLTAAIEAVNTLSSSVSSLVVDRVVKTILVLVDKCKIIKSKTRRLDRLVSLEGLLRIAVHTPSLDWPSHSLKKEAEASLTACKEEIATLNSASSSTADKQKKQTTKEAASGLGSRPAASTVWIEYS